MNNDPREPRQFTDMSDYPQNGYGLMDVDREEICPSDEEEIEGWEYYDAYNESDMEEGE